jgi:hypothetical protein
MANELTLTAGIGVSNAGYVQKTYYSYSADQSTLGAAQGIHNVTTSAAAVSYGDVSTPGMVQLQNLGTADVNYGPDSGGTMISLGTLAPGDVAQFRLASAVTLKMQAASGTQPVAYWILAA